MVCWFDWIELMVELQPEINCTVQPPTQVELWIKIAYVNLEKKNRIINQ